MQKHKKNDSDKTILLDSKKEDFDEKENDEYRKIKEDYERLLKIEQDDHLTHLTRCIKCGKKIEMYIYFCNSTCDDQFINKKEE